MRNCDWREQIKEAIWGFSNKEYQYKLWFEQNGIRGCPNEDMAMFFDDLWIEDYVVAENNCLTDLEQKGLLKFIKTLNDFIDKRRDTVDKSFELDAEVLYDKDMEWEAIRKEAKTLYNLFFKEENIERKIVENFTFKSRYTV